MFTEQLLDNQNSSVAVFFLLSTLPNLCTRMRAPGSDTERTRRNDPGGYTGKKTWSSDAIPIIPPSKKWYWITYANTGDHTSGKCLSIIMHGMQFQKRYPKTCKLEGMLLKRARRQCHCSNNVCRSGDSAHGRREGGRSAGCFSAFGTISTAATLWSWDLNGAARESATFAQRFLTSPSCKAPHQPFLDNRVGLSTNGKACSLRCIPSVQLPFHTFLAQFSHCKSGGMPPPGFIRWYAFSRTASVGTKKVPSRAMRPFANVSARPVS